MHATFVRLRIAGFKSFAEPVSIEILPGLTGIVGPNGCGKSNVVEALRWTMGEASARALRGGEMDDLIFAGTAARPARALAEVVLTLEDATGVAPPPLHEVSELQISRRIERGAGSFYRINGADARARDVQTLFADLATGARASAIVSQGRVASIINARPEERRSVLEEAAGITGLHARRHEAELKLRAAEANLARAGDLRQQLEAGAGTLRIQAGQAARYVEIGALLRQAEAQLQALLRARAEAAIRDAADAEQHALAMSRQALLDHAAAAQAELDTIAALPAPRAREAAARSTLERARLQAEAATEAQARAEAVASQARLRLRQATEDHEAATLRARDAADETARLEAEQQRLDEQLRLLPERLAVARTTLAQATPARNQAELQSRRDTALEAAARSGLAALTRDIDAATASRDHAAAHRSRIATELAEAEATVPDPDAMAASVARRAAGQHDLRSCQTALEQAQERLADATRASDSARMQAADMVRRRQEAERARDESSRRLAGHADAEAALRTRWQAAEADAVSERQHDEAVAATRAAEAALEQAARVRSIAETALAAAEQARAAAGQAKQEALADQARATAALSQARNTLVEAQALAAHLAAEQDAARAALPDPDEQRRADAALRQAGAASAALDDARIGAETRLSAAAEQATRTTDAVAALSQTLRLHAAEADGLAQVLHAGAGAGDWPSLGTLLEVPAGLEAAVAAWAGAGLDAALDARAPAAWLTLPPLPLSGRPLPEGTTALSDLLVLPEALAQVLARALSQTGLVEPEADGAALQRALHPGQCLVSRDGSIWRWDGWRSIGGTEDAPATIRLRQQARLRQAQAARDVADRALRPARDAEAAAAAGQARCGELVETLRRQRPATEQALRSASARQAELERQANQAQAALDAQAPHAMRAEQALAAAEAALAQAGSNADAAAGLAESRIAAFDAHQAAVAADVRALDIARAASAAAEATARDAAAQQATLAARRMRQVAELAVLTPELARMQAEARSLAASDQAVRQSLEQVLPEPAIAAAREADDVAATWAAAMEAARAARDHARSALASAEAQAASLETAARDGRGRCLSLSAQHEAARYAAETAETALAGLMTQHAALPDLELATTRAAAAAELLSQALHDEATAAAGLVTLDAEQATLGSLQAPLAARLSDWRQRLLVADATLAQATTRRDEATAALLAAEQVPAVAAARLLALETAAEHAQASHVESLAACDTAERDAQRAQAASRQAAANLGSAREAVVRAEAGSARAQAMLDACATGPEPDEPAAPPDDVSEAAETGLRRRVARLGRERDEIGPVNLLAARELAEMQGRIDAILHEGGEIETAIARLRGQIGQLNREGRERLGQAFERIDRQFQAVFARMFEGGRAHLALVGSDDPLLAGLELYAQPPGKKLAALSLLSGGEQALAALSLVFAVFRCNPAPICVLDEVDAPLDEANVERLCAALIEMAASSPTRFLVVTHHQVTMSHMDRLYGVTMQERGVSRVVSVDLAAAWALKEGRGPAS